jgi:aminomethyltransferase
MENKTPLYNRHIAAGGKIVPFAGYLLPVQYPSGVIAEHMAVRTAAGLFDISHMGEIILEGKDAFANLQHILTNDFSSMYDGRVRYTLMCYDNGGVVDDLVVYRINENKYLLVVNEQISFSCQRCKPHERCGMDESTSNRRCPI